MDKIKKVVIEARQIALKSEIRCLNNSEMFSSIEFERIGKKLDKVLRYIQENENGEVRQKEE